MTVNKILKDLDAYNIYNNLGRKTKIYPQIFCGDYCIDLSVHLDTFLQHKIDSLKTIKKILKENSFFTRYNDYFNFIIYNNFIWITIPENGINISEEDMFNLKIDSIQKKIPFNHLLIKTISGQCNLKKDFIKYVGYDSMYDFLYEKLLPNMKNIKNDTYMIDNNIHILWEKGISINFYYSMVKYKINDVL